MPTIAPLHSSVIAAIAAGEVVERPAVVVKELIENALDAHATSISIAIESGGLTKIEVTDNGLGMDLDDLQLAWQRHTTSKIVTADDLSSLRTYGFRGEALASMAAASVLTLRSRPATQSTGWEISIDHGQADAPQPMGMPSGTQVTVEQLFAKLPARRKFLKSAASEFRQIQQVVITSALARPEVGFFLSHNQKVVFFLPPKQTLEDRLSSLLPDAAQFLPMTVDNSPLVITGLLGAPAAARRQHPHQFVFVNERPVHITWLPTLLRNAYGSLLEPRSQPAFVIFITLPPDQVDINIHPRKELAQFLDEEHLKKAVQQWITDALAQNPEQVQYHQGDAVPAAWQVRDRSASPFTQQLIKAQAKAWKMTDNQLHFQQIHHTYLVAATPDALLIIDQHAAHERILFEQFRQEYQQQLTEREQIILQPPVTLRLSQLEANVLQDNLDVLQQLGIELSHFGGTDFHLQKVPAALKERNFEKLIHELLDDFVGNVELTGVDTVAERTLAYLACRSAVQAGDPLTSQQAQKLYEKLLLTDNYATCPHGRPTIITIHPNQFEKWFKRK